MESLFRMPAQLFKVFIVNLLRNCGFQLCRLYLKPPRPLQLSCPNGNLLASKMKVQVMNSGVKGPGITRTRPQIFSAPVKQPTLTTCFDYTPGPCWDEVSVKFRVSCFVYEDNYGEEKKTFGSY
ncbi:Hypothetical predicted protein [Scomber scombrus]|uniref:Uncharacterized protein n=1 Tax=Scomber scombrus TaxID=13677 RepID=A0AAV1PAQ0_SCOSC